MRIVKILGEDVSEIEEWAERNEHIYRHIFRGNSKEDLVKWSIGLGAALYDNEGRLVTPIYVDRRNERIKTLGLLFDCKGSEEILKSLLFAAEEYGITRIGEVYFFCENEENFSNVVERLRKTYSQIDGFEISELNVFQSDKGFFVEVGYSSRERSTITPYEYVEKVLRNILEPSQIRKTDENVIKYLVFTALKLREADMRKEEDVRFLERLNEGSFRNYSILPSDDEKTYIVELYDRKVAAIGSMEMPNGIVEISYAISPSWEGKGIITAAILKYLIHNWNGRRKIVYADCMHDRSLRAFMTASALYTFLYYGEKNNLSVGIHYAQLDAWARGMDSMYGFGYPGRGYITTFATYLTKNNKDKDVYLKNLRNSMIKVNVNNPLKRW